MSTSSSTRRQPTARASFQRQRPKGLGQRVFRVILLALVVGLLSALTTLYFVWPDFSLAQLKPENTPNQTTEHTATPEAAQRPKMTSQKPLFVDFEPFTVTLNQEGRSRILYVGITLQVANKDSRELLQEYQPVVRDRILHILSLQDPLQVQTAEGRKALAEQLSQTLSKPYPPADHGPEINHVLFTTFVVQ
ncbi:MAG TPA: flagellar basal body-associated FliL family protein [Paenalcaligenes sp.]|nr:flagellar basal body-associated FliL family protein [Paenalcaligenes sp.]